MERLGCHLLTLLLHPENNFCRSSLQESKREVNATFLWGFESQLFALFVSSLSSDWPSYMASWSPSSTEHLTGEESDQLTRQVSREAGRTDLSFEDRHQMNNCPICTLAQTPLMFSANQSLLGSGSWLRRWPCEYPFIPSAMKSKWMTTDIEQVRRGAGLLSKSRLG